MNSYKALGEILLRYWVSYGGWREIIRSPFMHCAVFFTALTAGYWSVPGNNWQVVATGVLPNLLGFGVTGYAIWIGWGDEKFREMLINIEVKAGVSAYVEVSATFAHFAVVQIFALMWALLYTAFNQTLPQDSLISFSLLYLGFNTDFFNNFLWISAAIGFFLFLYAITVALEATLALFRLATWLQKIKK
jgi:hypothetical protein